MILWVVLFALIVAISFILAARSMKDFTEIPTQDQEYSLFLIRNKQGLTKELLSSIKNYLSQSNLIISFERLFKGKKSAMVVFGPKKLLDSYKDSLNLLELEDYTDISLEDVSAWEVGIKSKSEQIIFTDMPELLETEQFWWQLIISNSFKPQITAVVVSADSAKRNSLTQSIQNLASESLIKLPKAYSNNQILDFYKKRSFRKDNKNPILNSEEALQLLLV